MISIRWILSAAVWIGLTQWFVGYPGALARAPVELDDPPLLLENDRTLSEAEQDRLDAVSLFSQGRMLEQRQDLPGALRQYQRAFRADPTAEPVLREIIPLAFSLNREAEAVRYATKLAQLDASDPALLRRLGVVLTEQGEHEQALALYEKVRELEKDQKKSSAQVLLNLEMGRLYVVTEKYDKAAALFKLVSQALDAPKEYGLNATLLKSFSGDKGEVHELMAAAFLEAGEMEETAKSFQRLEKFNANKAVAAYHQARLAAKNGRHDEALAKLQEYFDARETNKGAGPYELLAKVLEANNQSDQLIGRLEKLLAEQEGNLPLNFVLAEEYFKKEQLEKALSRYEVVKAKQPAGQVFRRMSEIYRRTKQEEKLLGLLGEIAEKSGSLEIVEKELKAIVEDEKLVVSLLEIARDKFGEAKAENHDELRAAGLVALEAKNHNAAGELLELALQAKPADKAPVLLVWGLELFVAEKFADAAKVFQRGIDEKVLPESNPAFYFYLAGALSMEGKVDEALAAARTAVEKKADDPRFESRIAWIYYHAKRHDDAAKQYRELLKKYEANHESPEVRSVVHDTRLILSNIAVLQNKLPDAEEWIGQALDEFPDDAGALNDLGYLWADQNKRLRRASRMIRQAVEAEPENAAYRDSLGWVLYRLGKFDEALKEQQKAVELSKSKDKQSDGVMYDHLGDIHAALAQKDKAIESWTEAARAFEKVGEKDKLEAVRRKITNDETRMSNE